MLIHHTICFNLPIFEKGGLYERIKKLCACVLTISVLATTVSGMAVSASGTAPDLSDMDMISTSYNWRLERTILVQRFLNKSRSAGLTEDGIYGKLSKSAVMRFQSEKGITADGVVGPNTWKKIYASFPSHYQRAGADPFSARYYSATSSKTGVVASFTYGSNGRGTWRYAYGTATTLVQSPDRIIY